MNAVNLFGLSSEQQVCCHQDSNQGDPALKRALLGHAQACMDSQVLNAEELKDCVVASSNDEVCFVSCILGQRCTTPCYLDAAAYGQCGACLPAAQRSGPAIAGWPAR